MIYEIKKTAIKWFGNIIISKYPLFVTFGHTAYKIKGEDVRNILNVIKPGDILLRRFDSYVSGLMIPGYFTHAAIYIGDDQIIHMLGDGITKEDILTFTRCDDIAIIHCNQEQISNIAIEKAIEYLNKGEEYDYNFDFSNDKRLSCTELVNDVYNNPKFTRLKKDYIMPDDLLTLDKSVFTISYKKG